MHNKKMLAHERRSADYTYEQAAKRIANIRLTFMNKKGGGDMTVSLSKITAQKIVNTVKDVCGHDINFINPNGIIFASTNSTRIGNYHEIGRQVAESRETIEVETDDSFYGTHKGVNIPFVYNRELIAVIGISGVPDEVRQYAVLAQKITALILREQELDSLKFGQKNRMNYVIKALIEGRTLEAHQVTELLQECNEQVEEEYRVILVRLNSRYNPSNLSMIENLIYRTFDQAKGHLYTFQYPNEYVLLLPEKAYGQWGYVFQKFAEKYEKILDVGVGNVTTLWRQKDSYQAAQTALMSLTEYKNYACYDELD
ncbi:MAG: sugar diacid recognition domain-containing protein, partial [Eubacteriales bacterium]|nr:sugar diacid recognition domain-containing protein [Eubacteriales bacterium]